MGAFVRRPSVRAFVRRICVLVPVVWACADLSEPPPDPRAARVQHHVDGALELLRSAPPVGLSALQAQARLRAIGWLDEYRSAGVFPHNHVRPGERIPVFVDAHGTPCAVGYLLLRSGEDALVESIVRESILAPVRELKDDPRLSAWLERTGLTLEEIARIQPTYEGGGGVHVVDDPSSRYAGTTVGLSIVTAAAAALSELTPPDPSGFEWAGAANLATLAGHGLLFALTTREGDAAPFWPIGLNLAGMALSGTAAIRRFSRRHDAAVLRNDAAFIPHIGASRGQVHLGFALLH